jgi:hypothetical protein
VQTAPNPSPTPTQARRFGAASAATDARRILLVEARGPMHGDRPPVPLGVLSRKADGWHFNPLTVAHQPSRKGKPTWEKAIPRWTGGLDRTESRRMEPGESIADVLARF